MLKQNALLATIPSDSHSWNLVFMEFLLSDLGMHAHNLGPNTPMTDVLEELDTSYFDMVVISSVNGHGAIEGAELAKRIREETNYNGDIYMGGKICTATDEVTVGKHVKAWKVRVSTASLMTV